MSPLFSASDGIGYFSLTVQYIYTEETLINCIVQ